MWFKNIKVFQFANLKKDPKAISASLQELEVPPCSGLQPGSVGFY